MTSSAQSAKVFFLPFCLRRRQTRASVDVVADAGSNVTRLAAPDARPQSRTPTFSLQPAFSPAYKNRMFALNGPHRPRRLPQHLTPSCDLDSDASNISACPLSRRARRPRMPRRGTRRQPCACPRAARIPPDAPHAPEQAPRLERRERHPYHRQPWLAARAPEDVVPGAQLQVSARSICLARGLRSIYARIYVNTGWVVVTSETSRPSSRI